MTDPISRRGAAGAVAQGLLERREIGVAGEFVTAELAEVRCQPLGV